MKYGWKPDHHDPRDYLFKVSAPVQIQSVDLREKYKFDDIFNQGNTSSCTGNSGAFDAGFCILNGLLQVPNKIDLPLSRLFIYFNARQLEGSTHEDCGAQIRDVLKGIANVGVCSEKTWPFDSRKVCVQPSPEAYAEAINFKAIQYDRVNSVNKNELVGCLLEGYPFIFGFKVYKSFESDEVARTGIVNMPEPGERVVGGHAVVGLGYDLPSDRFIVANSWGKDWGQNGFFTIPADYLCNLRLANDFWATKLLL